MAKSGTQVNADVVARYVSKRGNFTTENVMSRFNITKQSAAANIAILRIRRDVEPDSPPKTKDGISRWVWVGK